MTRRRWIAEHWDEATATIVGAQAEHMARVLRAQPGMEADVVAGGHVFHAEVAAVSPNEIRFNLIAELQADPALPVTLVVAVYKLGRMGARGRSALRRQRLARRIAGPAHSARRDGGHRRAGGRRLVSGVIWISSPACESKAPVPYPFAAFWRKGGCR